MAPEAKKPNIVRRLYDWVLSWAESPYALPALFLLAFTESSFFPIPPDVLLIALALSAPTKAFRFAAWCTVGSVLGGMFGYLLGFVLWSSLEPLLIPAVFSAELFPGISANPYLSFYFKVPEPGEFEFTWVEDGGARAVEKQKLNVV